MSEQPKRLPSDEEIKAAFPAMTYKQRLRVAAIVRATMEEDARAVCPDCKHEVALEEFKKNGKTYWSHQSEKGDTARCDAGPIHDRIAALDKEVSHE